MTAECGAVIVQAKHRGILLAIKLESIRFKLW